MIYLRGSVLYSRYVRYYMIESDIVGRASEWYRACIQRQSRGLVHLHFEYYSSSSSRSSTSTPFPPLPWTVPPEGIAEEVAF